MNGSKELEHSKGTKIYISMHDQTPFPLQILFVLESSRFQLIQLQDTKSFRYYQNKIHQHLGMSSKFLPFGLSSFQISVK